MARMAPLDVAQGMALMSLPGVYIEVLTSPNRYSERQLNQAMTLAWALRRGRFLLLETPEHAG